MNVIRSVALLTLGGCIARVGYGLLRQKLAEAQEPVESRA
jgi:hypothetical protein